MVIIPVRVSKDIFWEATEGSTGEQIKDGEPENNIHRCLCCCETTHSSRDAKSPDNGGEKHTAQLALPFI